MKYVFYLIDTIILYKVIILDSTRAKQIISSKDKIEVLYQGSPVWIESIKDNNTAEITNIDSQERIDVPVYKLVENNPLS